MVLNRNPSDLGLWEVPKDGSDGGSHWVGGQITDLGFDLGIMGLAGF